jgi:UDP-2,3-diacylglucosamine hydrolase
LRRSELGRYTGFVPPNAAVIVADAHLGDPREQDADSFHRFLDSVPQLANHIVINGDLFDFWFEYRSVISRSAFPTLAALAKLRSAGVELTVTGGNHDRWGGGFWATELGGAFYRDSAEVELVGWKALVTHGDGVGEEHVAGRIMHAITRHPLTAAGFRLVHPDLGYGLVRRLSRFLADRTRASDVLDQAAEAQKAHAQGLLADRADLNLVVMAHTHRPALVEVDAGRWYLNPGAWMEERCYALVTPEGPELRRFSC